MAQGYYTLQEAAQFLGMSADELRQMAHKNQIRSFQDRGTLRFRIQDIQELARQRGAASDMELPLGEAPPKTPRSGIAAEGTPETFDFDLAPPADDDDLIPLGLEPMPGDGPVSSRSKVKKGSDSDVRLVPQPSVADVKLVGDPGGFSLEPEATVKPPSSKPRPASKLGGPASPPQQRRSTLGQPVPEASRKSQVKVRSQLAPGQSKRQSALRTPPPQPMDSGVRLVPLDDDSSVKIIGVSSDEIPLGASPIASAADSDIRLERFAKNEPRNEEAMLLTEEINLDAELQKALEPLPVPKVKPKSVMAQMPSFPTESPFELSSDGRSKLASASSIGGTTAPGDSGSSDFELTPGKDSSSDFDLVPSAEGDIMLEGAGGDDFSLELPDDVGLQTGDEGSMDFDLTLEASPAQKQVQGDSEEFELSLDDGSSGDQTPLSSDDSGFELTLDAGDSSASSDPGSSDSEFELTLDDSGQMEASSDSGEKDIFETDFDVPALEDESGSQVAALDTDLEGSEFDFALGDSDGESEDPSGSAVVALDDIESEDSDDVEVEEEEEDPKPKKKGKDKKKKSKLASSEFSELEEFDDVEVPVSSVSEDDIPAREVVREKWLRPAPWGALPVVVMLPCVLLMFVVGILGFELVQSAGGYKSAGYLTRTIAQALDIKIK